jgi:DNA-binding transcriptional ArsR family regulator
MPDISSDSEFAVIARCIRAMSCPVRLNILYLLRNGEQSVNNIALAVACRQPRTSVSLYQLNVNRLVKSKKMANQVYYAIADRRVLKIMDMLETQFPAN